jgi:hypothetical protein
LFLGQLNDRPTIWQCKHFPNGLGPKQRPQVKESLRTAVEHFKPVQWILMISIDLDSKAHEWFQKLQRSYAGKTAIGFFQASDIVRELIRRRSLQDAFFPGAVFDAVAVRRCLTGLGDATPGDLDRLVQEPMDELIARLEQADARFNYQISYGPNVGPEIAATPPSHPMLIASLLEEGKRIDVFARDLKALCLDLRRLNSPLLARVSIRSMNCFEQVGRTNFKTMRYCMLGRRLIS